MLLALCDVPSYERHLLFCTDPQLGARAPCAVDDLSAINRALTIHGETVDEASLDSTPTSPNGALPIIQLA